MKEIDLRALQQKLDKKGAGSLYLVYGEELFLVDEAIKAYRNAPNDPDLASLLCLFGSSEMVMPRWKRQGDVVMGLNEKGAELVRVPMYEPVHVRPAYDPLHQIQRTNCP